MSSIRRVRAFAARSIIALALALGLSFLPTPAFDFVPTAAAATSSLAGLTPTSDGRVSGGEALTEPFSVVGLSLSHETNGPVRVRVRDADQGWGAWEELAVEGSDGPDEDSPEHAPAFVSEPYVHVDAAGYEFELDAADAAEAEVTIVREVLSRVVSEATPLADASVASLFPVHSRASWGARPSKAPSRTAPSIKLAVVHHTAGQNNYSQGSVPGILRGIQAYHQDGRGWDDIGYNFLVDRFGGIWEGRAGSMKDNVVGAHASGFNTGSMGVSVLGDFAKTSANSPIVEAVSKVAAWRLWSSGADPTGHVTFVSSGSPKYEAGRSVTLPRIVGHRDVGLTTCPGSLHGLLPTIRAKAKALYAKWGTELVPVGVLDPIGAKGQSLTIRGWAQVLGTENPVVVHVYVNGKGKPITANRSRPDVPKARPELRANIGYEVVFDNLPKNKVARVCAYGVSQGTGGNSTLGCREVLVK